MSEPAQHSSKKVVVEVYHLGGFEGAAQNSRGLFSLSRDRLAFTSSKRSDEILSSEITQIDLDHDSRAFLPGKASTPIRFAPYQSGLLSNSTPTTDDVLTLDYRDKRGGLHEAVLLLSREAGTSFASSLGNTQNRQINFGDQTAFNKETTDGPDVGNAIESCQTCTAIQLGRFENSVEGIPASVRAMLYENLFAELRSSGHFDQVLRAGEKPAVPLANVQTLNVALQSFVKGRSSVRDVAILSGRPYLSVSIRVTGLSGRAILDKTLTASLTGRGEDLDVCETMSKKIVKLLQH